MTDTNDDIKLAQALQEQFDRPDFGFAVEPITTCPHIPNSIATQVFIDTPCQSCNEPKENWQCLTCDHTVLCSRYRNGHMLDHFEKNKDHAVCLSYSDLSVWCFVCENYIVNEALDNLKHAAYMAKFGEEPPQASTLVVQDNQGAGSSSCAAGGSGSSSSNKQ
ncbi:hypothetical protein BDA99DRAFT_491673 [Phascolomyces articulosus]|uniref:UBP-type domain-containing protein n=1 Tax=Phascolomyces articulosus TaxID=60185 RepID=A0AAD5PKC5_9FUNG|nr:hypothetical protein BDA99DRAFT_491673 [Phascolomyces articulosus]